jgi:multidrug efflux pump subunit AcrB
MMATEERTPFLTRVVATFLRADLVVTLMLAAFAMGVAALVVTPREEEPQIVVPLADVLIRAPGLSAEEVEQQIALRLEKLLYQIDGVEYVYSISRPGECVVTVRFYVGEDREDSLTKLYNKIYSNIDQVPPGVESWVVKPIEIDDVPILNITLWSDRPDLYGDHELRRVAEQIEHELQRIPNTNRVEVLGGRPRQIRVLLKPMELAARQTAPLDVIRALRASNVNVRSGTFEQQDREFIVEAGPFIGNKWELEDLVVQVSQGRPVYLKDVADVIDGPAEVESYSWIGFGPAATTPRHPKDPHSPFEHGHSVGGRVPETSASSGTVASPEIRSGELYPAVHIAVAKRKGSNAVWVAEAVQKRMAELADPNSPDYLIPPGIYYRITRDYGETSNDKVNELVESLAIAVITVVGLIGVVIGWRAALVVALAVPICYGVTLFINYLAGYSINRVTLFALILALGLLVDDPITDVENIARYFAMRRFPPRESVLRAVQEVRPALIMSTLAIIVCFIPMMYITGMMGPYMAPMALNVPLTVTVSTFVAFMITPYLAMVALPSPKHEEPPFELTRTGIYRISRVVLGGILSRKIYAWLVLIAVFALLVAAILLPAFRLLPLKMLPYDNKNEFQIVVDMPEGTTLERTEFVTRRLAASLATVPEVRDYQLYVGFASPMDFNAMVRKYYLRRGSHLADIRVNLVHKHYRAHQSHEILLRIRNQLTRIAEEHGANIKLVEVPPGPPVLSTIVAEVYGPPGASYQQICQVAGMVEKRLRREPFVVDIDSTVEAVRPLLTFEVDQAKAALSGISKENIAQTLAVALGGMPVTEIHDPREIHPLRVVLRLPRELRSAVDDLEDLYVRGETGQLVQLGELGRFVERAEEQTIYHKNLRRVVYVTAEVAGRPPADAILDMELDRVPAGQPLPPASTPRPLNVRTWFYPGGGDPWNIPPGFEVHWAGEGEWKITLDVFRDLGIAFAVALLAIFVLLMFETGSRILPLIIMLAIPLTAIGIMPGFWFLNWLVNYPIDGYPNPVFFTATAMIGMIGLAGIVVRNSVVLIDFIQHAQAAGLDLREAIVQSVAVRARPIFLTSGTTLLGNWVITLDPIFSGLAWAIIFGIFASTAFTMVVVPVVYYLLYVNRPLPQQ